MNLLVFARDELSADFTLKVNGERARHLLDVLRVEVGKSLRVGEIGGGSGLGEVVSTTQDEVTLRVGKLGEAQARPAVDLILAMPRPQTLKKVLQTAATMGIGELTLIGANQVERAYFSSPILNEANLQHYLRLGLEQGMNTWCPQVKVFPRFADFLSKFLAPKLGEWDLKVIAHPLRGQTLFTENLKLGGRTVIAIGPESGWLPAEVETFSLNGFQAISISDKILRVESAVCALLAQFEMHRRMTMLGDGSSAVVVADNKDFHGKSEKQTLSYS